jgi:hypothetical protein
VSDLQAISSEAVPRSEPLCQRYAPIVEPTFGFAIYAALWFAVVGVIAGVIVFKVLPVGPIADNVDLPESTIRPLALLGAIVASAWPFMAWARGKRKRARAFVRFAAIATGTVRPGAAFVQNAGWRSQVDLEYGGVRFWVYAFFVAQPAPGAQAYALVLPGARYALAFDEQGTATATKVNRG